MNEYCINLHLRWLRGLNGTVYDTRVPMNACSGVVIMKAATKKRLAKYWGYILVVVLYVSWFQEAYS
jgi:hypothetical protein